MQSKTLRLKKGFTVLFSNARAQAAEMVLGRGEKEGGPDNRHRGSDQWLYVLEGTGVAVINGQRKTLKPKTLLLIEHGDRHEIRNTGAGPLCTVNFYIPPAYNEKGDELPRGRK